MISWTLFCKKREKHHLYSNNISVSKLCSFSFLLQAAELFVTCDCVFYKTITPSMWHCYAHQLSSPLLTHRHCCPSASPSPPLPFINTLSYTTTANQTIMFSQSFHGESFLYCVLINLSCTIHCGNKNPWIFTVTCVFISQQWFPSGFCWSGSALRVSAVHTRIITIPPKIC